MAFFLFFCNGSQWQPLDPFENFWWNLALSLRTVPFILTPSFMFPIAPPMGQSWTLVSTRNFWTVCQNTVKCIKNEVPLDSLDQDEFNTLYDANFRSYRFSAISGFIKNLWKLLLLQFLSSLLQTCQRWSSDQASQNVCHGIPIFELVCPWQPIKFSWKATKQEFGSNLSKSLRYHHQTWYISGRH